MPFVLGAVKPTLKLPEEFVVVVFTTEVPFLMDMVCPEAEPPSALVSFPLAVTVSPILMLVGLRASVSVVATEMRT